MKKLVCAICIISMVLAAFISGINAGDTNVVSNPALQSNDIKNNIKELCKKEYMGKKPGTAGYKNAALYLQKLYEQAGLKPVLKNSLIQEYDTMLTTLKSESLVINGRPLEIMKDYMPFSGCAVGAYSGKRDAVFVKAGMDKDYAGLNVSGKTVIMTWYDEKGMFPAGMRDRILIAKGKGASEVLIVCNGELKVGNYEHPLNENDMGIYVQYITQDVASWLDIKNYSSTSQFTMALSYSIDIERGKKAVAQNIVGMVEGIDKTKSILLVTNMDGYGSLPNGIVYQNAKLSVVAPVMLSELAKYYKDNRPKYNIVFAVVGNKWDNGLGAEALMSSIDSNSLIAVVDLYAMGGENPIPYIGYSSKMEAYLYKNLTGYFRGEHNNDLGNALSSVIGRKLNNIVMLRGNNTWVDDAQKDTWDAVDFSNFAKEQDYVRKVVDGITLSYQEKIGYQYSVVPVRVRNDLVQKEYMSLESKFFTVLFDEGVQNQVAQLSFLKEIDKIYTRISAYNYHASLSKKPFLIISEDTMAAAKIGERKDIYENNLEPGGGFASFHDAGTKVVFCKEPYLGTVSHEINHLLAGEKLPNGFFVAANQEAQGQTYNIFYADNDFLNNENRIKDIIHYTEPSLKDKDQSYVAKNYKTDFSWNWFVDVHSNPYQHQNSYFTLGSMYSFIYYNYGPKTARRAIYRVYEANSANEIPKALIKDTGMNEAQFMEEWSEWMLSDGTNMVDKEVFDISKYKDTLTPYDEKWCSGLQAKDDETRELVINMNPADGIPKVTEQPQKQAPAPAFVDKYDIASISVTDKAVSGNIKYETIPNKKYKVELGTDKTDLYIRITYNITSKRDPFICIFLMGDQPGLKTLVKCEKNKGTAVIKLTKSSVLSFPVDMMVNLGNYDFIQINKDVTDKLCKK